MHLPDNRLFRPWLSAFLAVAVAGLVSAQVTTGFPPKGKPAEAGWGHYQGWADGWLGYHNKLLARTAKGDVGILFLGDSLTMLWDKEGKAIWDARFAPLKAANYGIGGDSTRQVIWRIENGELDGLAPRLVVLMIGTNNIYNDHNSGTDAEIVEGVSKIIALIGGKSPSTKVLLLGVLPRQNKFFTDRTAGLNTRLAAFAVSKKIMFADFSAKFLDADGKISAALYKPDLVHLTGEGYRVLADALQPLIEGPLKP